MLSKLILILLAVLQLFAPLVHGHTGSNGFDRGLHMPGLEIYNPVKDTAVTHTVNINHYSEGLLVEIESGVKIQHDLLIDCDNCTLVSILSEPVKMPTVSGLDCKFAQQFTPPNHFRPHNTHPSRAPPTV